jgi:hypothetical protein
MENEKDFLDIVKILEETSSKILEEKCSRSITKK